ncbi:pilus assembly protein CpaB [Loktanella sp. 5RATIMAR09]|uniref:Flp pilus assembly protein CpaB n=1 Tax=Loktanella sp. 5RATIMAR09 TaxID=1225655 RepID=UPI0006EB2A48|nr:Flp pilus assembly protein CpaB [Loktanella sp. 5RATIMAR09]KQI71175.1 pilus assembly protein CpaB [Loktanella sp. 5RATIMAR09]
MRAVFGLVLLIGMGLAGFAVYMVNQYMETQASQLERERQRSATALRTVDIYAPSRSLTYGDLLTVDDVQIIKYARDYLPDGVFATEEELFPQGLNVPRVVRIPMQANEPILNAKVTEAGAPQGITALLDPGMRAFPLPNNMTQAFAGDLRNSDLIDLYWVGRVDGGQSISRLVKSRLEIIAMDARNGGVVIQVSQEDFADLQVLQSAGVLSLTPVGRNDLDAGDTTIETNIRDVLGIVEEVRAPEPEVVEEERCFVTQRNGTERIQVEVECAN